jgi:nicotinate-nucleotide pyrophosphorylase (carboxylating)
LIKDNHIALCGGIEQAIKNAKISCGHMVKIEIEVDTLAQLESVLAHEIDAILLDNMSPKQLTQAVKLVRDRAKNHILLEASGGVTLKTVRDIAQSGVDVISVGGLTHSVEALDIGLDIAL